MLKHWNLQLILKQFEFQSLLLMLCCYFYISMSELQVSKYGSLWQQEKLSDPLEMGL